MCGVANITSDGGGLPEVLEHGVTGLVTRAGDLENLRETIRQLARDSKLRSRLARAGQARAIESFTFERQIDRTREAYHYALNSTARHAHEP